MKRLRPDLTPAQKKAARLARRRERLHDDTQPADAVTCRLFENLYLAQEARRNHSRKLTRQQLDEFERQTWKFLIDYLVTLERPDVASFKLLD